MKTEHLPDLLVTDSSESLLNELAFEISALDMI